MSEPAGFIKFWAAYPRKQAKAMALKAWEKLGCEMFTAEIVAHVERRARDDAQWKTKRLIPQPATFINQMRWQDEDYETVDDRRREHDKGGTNRGPAPMELPEVRRGVLGLLSPQAMLPTKETVEFNEAYAQLRAQPYSEDVVLRTFAVSSSQVRQLVGKRNAE